jgi:hypothetical protein
MDNAEFWSIESAKHGLRPTFDLLVKRYASTCNHLQELAESRFYEKEITANGELPSWTRVTIADIEKKFNDSKMYGLGDDHAFHAVALRSEKDAMKLGVALDFFIDNPRTAYSSSYQLISNGVVVGSVVITD